MPRKKIGLPAFLSEQPQSREKLRRGQSEPGLNLQTVRAFKAITDEEAQIASEEQASPEFAEHFAKTGEQEAIFAREFGYRL